MKKWSNNICRVGQGDEHTWVTGPCCIILRTWCVFGENDLFDPRDLGWPLTRSRVIWHMRAGSLIIVTKFHWNRSKQLEGTLGYMVDRRKKKETRSGNRSGHSRLCDFKWPQINIWPHKIARGSQVDQHVWVLRSCYVTWMSHSIFSENDLTPVTPDWHLTP